MNELAYASAKEIARLVRTREVSPVEIVDYFLARIEERNRALNAFVFVDADGARDRARAAEKALYSGETLGPLHGVPAALKDLFDYRPGWVNTLGGIRALAQHRCDQYSIFAQRVEESGAIMLGGTNAPTFGFRAYLRQLLVRTFQNAVRPENEFRRIVGRKRGRRRRWPCAIRARDRRRGIDPHPGSLLWGIWLQTRLWKGSDALATQSIWCDISVYL